MIGSFSVQFWKVAGFSQKWEKSWKEIGPGPRVPADYFIVRPPALIQEHRSQPKNKKIAYIFRKLKFLKNIFPTKFSPLSSRILSFQRLLTACMVSFDCLLRLGAWNKSFFQTKFPSLSAPDFLSTKWRIFFGRQLLENLLQSLKKSVIIINNYYWRVS